MIHIVKLIQRRFPESSGKIIGAMVFLVLGLLLVGVGLLALR